MSGNVAEAPKASAIRMPAALPGSQIHMADIFAANAASRLRFVWAEKQWFRWDGIVWRKDETGHVRELIRGFLAKQSIDAEGSENIRRAWASARQIGDVERICQHDKRLVATPDQWDADEALLCTPGGIVDLTTGEVREARPEDYCRKITACVPADPGTLLGPLFKRVLDNVTSGDAALARYMQKVAGYCLFSGQQEKALFIVVGETNSGKSTLFKTLRLVMSEYATSTNVENFLEDPRHFRTSTNNLAEIGNVRLVVTGEPDPGAALSASWIKRLVGIDETHMRLNYQKGRVAATTYKIVIHCNEIPRLGQGGDSAVRERLRILVTKPFEIRKHADGRFDLRIMARSLEEIDRLVPHIAAALALPEDNLRHQLANGQAMMVEQRPEVVPFNMTFGGSDALRSAAKSCLVLWALKIGNDEVRREPYASVRNFILNGDDRFVRMRTQLDTRALDAIGQIKEAYGPLFNLVYVRSDHAGKVIGHFTIYNVIASQIVLAEHGGVPGQVTGLVSNPFDPGVWSDRAATLFDVPFNWLERPRHDLPEAQARFSAVMETYFNVFRPKEIERLSSEVFRKHGLGPNDNIPPELREETINELLRRVAHHAVGLPLVTPITEEELKRALKLSGEADSWG